VGTYSGTPEDKIQLYRCGNSKYPGCGKILTEGQRMHFGGCPYCESYGAVSYYPKGWWNKLKAYCLVMKTGELWLKSEKSRRTS
jgi:hypothetical protein